MVEWHLYIPQSRMGIDDLVLRARAAEASAFDGWPSSTISRHRWPPPVRSGKR